MFSFKLTVTALVKGASPPPSHYIQLFLYLFYRPVKLSVFVQVNCYGASEGSVSAPLSPHTLFLYLFYRPAKLSGFIQANCYGASEGSVSAPLSQLTISSCSILQLAEYSRSKLTCYSASEGVSSLPSHGAQLVILFNRLF